VAPGVTITPIVALDVATSDAALAIVDELGPTCRFYKVGSELFTAAGPAVVRDIRARGAEVFLDLKFHDIPNTVAGAVRNAAALGARLLTVHAVGGIAMLRAAVAAAGDPARCGILAVSVLTSLDAPAVAAAWGRDPRLETGAEVLRLAGIAAEGGVAGLVCSGREARLVKNSYGSALAVLIPGIRPSGSDAHDQSRTTTPAEAVASGAEYVVLGRAVTASGDRRAALDEMRAQLS
jgi:orotidine-5'-phosphate decarboxylase